MQRYLRDTLKGESRTASKQRIHFCRADIFVCEWKIYVDRQRDLRSTGASGVSLLILSPPDIIDFPPSSPATQLLQDGDLTFCLN